MLYLVLDQSFPLVLTETAVHKSLKKMSVTKLVFLLTCYHLIIESVARDKLMERVYKKTCIDYTNMFNDTNQIWFIAAWHVDEGLVPEEVAPILRVIFDARFDPFKIKITCHIVFEVGVMLYWHQRSEQKFMSFSKVIADDDTVLSFDLLLQISNDNSTECWSFPKTNKLKILSYKGVLRKFFSMQLQVFLSTDRSSIYPWHVYFLPIEYYDSKEKQIENVAHENLTFNFVTLESLQSGDEINTEEIITCGGLGKPGATITDFIIISFVLTGFIIVKFCVYLCNRNRVNPIE